MNLRTDIMKLGVALLITPMFMPPNQMNIIQSGVLLPAPFAEVSARLPALGLFRIEFTLGANDHALRLFVQRFGIDGDGKTHRLADLGLGAISIEGFIFKIVARVPLAAAVWLFGAAIGALAVRRPR